MQSFTVGPQFKGVKMLPPGPHLISYNASGSSSDFAPTISFYAHLAPRQVLVRRWDAAEEMLLPLQDPDEVQCLSPGACMAAWLTTSMLQECTALQGHLLCTAALHAEG